jgi:hypothetical protein
MTQKSAAAEQCTSASQKLSGQAQTSVVQDLREIMH